ncbi:MAG TPA: dihydrodipicolinate synthase family protein, partial [Chloroflexia bacterium]
MKVTWSGVLPAITTPFNADYSVDHGFFAEHIRWMAD